jgi:hypothetical protein
VDRYLNNRSIEISLFEWLINFPFFTNLINDEQRGLMKKILFLICVICTFNAKAEIALSDLGLSNTPIESEAQKKLDKVMIERTSKLKTHEVLGLATWGAMTATMLTGNSAMDSNMHMNLGIATGLLYFTTAYYSLTAAKPTDIKDKSRMKWHKGLAWVHFPAMILTPILGYMYKKHEEENKKHSSLEKQHSAVAGILYGSFTISAALMVIEF